MVALIEQVEELIRYAQCQAHRTGRRQRVEAVRSDPRWRGPGRWYYQVRDTAAWPNMLKREVS